MNQPAHIERRSLNRTPGWNTKPLRRVIEWPTAPSICKILRRRRIELGQTQMDLAVQIGVSRVFLGFWERGIKYPTEFNLQCWKDALGYKG